MNLYCKHPVLRPINEDRLALFHRLFSALLLWLLNYSLYLLVFCVGCKPIFNTFAQDSFRESVIDTGLQLGHVIENLLSLLFSTVMNLKKALKRKS